MMSKNIIVILCDSLTYDDNMLDDMPNVARYRENIIDFNNYFSQGPYTEAALAPLLTASNVLDYNGYFNNLKDRPFNINEIFKSLGYKTYNTLWLYSNTLSFLRGVDEYDYVDTSSITYGLVKYRFKYFEEKYNNNELTSDHMSMVISILDDFFKMIHRYIYDYDNNRHRFSMLMEYTEFHMYDFAKFKLDAKKNYERYLENKQKYIFELLSNGNNFFNEDYYPIKRSQEFQHNLPKLNKEIHKRMIKQMGYSIKNGFKNNCISTLKYTIKNYKNEEVTFNSIKQWTKHTINYPGKYLYENLSAKVLFDRVYEYLWENRENKNFIFCHVMDNHYPFNFFSGESSAAGGEISSFLSNKNEFSKEENNFYKYSKRYVDAQIGHLLRKLEDSGQLDETTIIITSDHGSSYTGKIHRTEICSTFYDENYRIPLMIFSKKIKHRTVNNLSISTQFIPTILNFLEAPYSERLVKENSILERNNKYIIFEYFGPGCPDYTKKAKLFCIRSRRYKIQYRLQIRQEEKTGEVIAIYDLYTDPNELINIRNKYERNKEIEYLMDSLQQRINSLI